MKGFRDFINKGNVIGLATAVVIGTAFTAIVTALVTGLVNPLIGALFNADNLKNSLQVTIPISAGGPQPTLQFGAVIAAAINFILIAAIVYFVFVLPYAKFLARQEAKRKAGAPEEDAPPTQEELLTQIRDLLAAQQQQ